MPAGWKAAATRECGLPDGPRGRRGCAPSSIGESDVDELLEQEKSAPAFYRLISISKIHAPALAAKNERRIPAGSR
jgi:hypothetical protein